MSSANQPEPPPLPPEVNTGQFNWRRPQFSVATLLGLLTLVAVACVLVLKMPGLGMMLVQLLAEVAFAGYAAFLVAGAWLSNGRSRLFCIAAVATLVLTLLPGAGTAAVGQMLFRDLGMSSGLAYFVWGFVGIVERIALSLFGGWVALRAARYWQPNKTEPTR